MTSCWFELHTHILDSHVLWDYSGTRVEVLYNTNQACGTEEVMLA